MNQLKPFRWTDYFFFYGIPFLLNYIACRVAIPFFENNSSLPIEVIYFISVGGIALIPMFFGALYFAGKEAQSYKPKDLLNRMRVFKLSKRDWGWTVATFVLLGLFSFLIAKLLMPRLGLDATPFFFKNMPLDSAKMWILYVWPLFFFFNILGEEFLWRGYIQPRQELVHGKMTWFIHGILWAGWHIPMGFNLILASLPIFFILPAVVQIRKNTSIAIVVHAIFGALGFLALALGAVF